MIFEDYQSTLTRQLDFTLYRGIRYCITKEEMKKKYRKGDFFIINPFTSTSTSLLVAEAYTNEQKIMMVFTLGDTEA